MASVPGEIFKAYDIRGIVGHTLTAVIVELIGRALGSSARAKNQTRMVIGRDGRLSGEALASALAQGIRASGVSVIDVGQVATPMLYFATHHFQTGSGVMVTGSHNPPEYNGLKMLIAGETLATEEIQQLRQRVEQENFTEGEGSLRVETIREQYLSRIAQDITLARPMHIAIDCGNGVAGAFAPELYRRLGCTVDELYCEVDGNFPNHHPDPSQPKNLQDLIAHLAHSNAEVGLAFDGDGDRLGVVAKNGAIVYPDRQLMLFAQDVLSRVPGAEIIFDVKCTRNLFAWIRAHGGRPEMWKTGHSLIKARMKQTGAALAGEMSGHIFFQERWYGFDDGLYAGARLLEVLSRQSDITKAFNSLPDSVNTPELQIALEEGENHRFIDLIQGQAKFPAALDINTIDGLRVEYKDGFGLVRASNTTPVLVLRFEADDHAALDRIQTEFRNMFEQFAPHARIPF
jgi:phosphomannomutase / phosphoglucomutase